jgi:hypothetical protein
MKPFLKGLHILLNNNRLPVVQNKTLEAILEPALP